MVKRATKTGNPQNNITQPSHIATQGFEALAFEVPDPGGIEAETGRRARLMEGNLEVLPTSSN